MRRPSPYTDRREEVEIKMTPMIDVVFLLLVFFIWTSSFRIAEQVLPSSLTAVAGTETAEPDQPPPPEEDFDRIVIRVVRMNGQIAWRINDVPVSNLEQVRTRLQAVAQIKRDAPVILHPDPEIPLGSVIDIYDITRLIGFEEIQFAASVRI